MHCMHAAMHDCMQGAARLAGAAQEPPHACMHACMQGDAHLACAAGAAASSCLKKNVQHDGDAIADVLVVALRDRANVEHGRAGRVPQRVRRGHPEPGLARRHALSLGTLACTSTLAMSVGQFNLLAIQNMAGPRHAGVHMALLGMLDLSQARWPCLTR